MPTHRRASPSKGAIPPRLLLEALDAVSAKIALLDDNGNILYVNRAWQRFAPEHGLDGADYEVGGNYLRRCESSCDESGARIAAGLRDMLARKQEEFQLEYAVGNAGESAWFRLRATRFASGGQSWLAVVQEDISLERQKEGRLRQNELRLRRFHQISHDNSLSLEQRIERLLALGCETFGLELGILARIEDATYTVERVYPPEGGIARGAVFDLAQTYCEKTLVAETPISFIHAGDSEWASHPCYLAFRLEAYLAAPLHVGRKPVGTLNFSSPTPRQQPFTDADRAFLEVMAQWVEEELERRAAEQALRESEGRLSAILKHAPVPIFLKDKDGRYLLASEEYFQASVVGKTDYDWFPPAVAEVMQRNDRRVLETGEALELEESAPLKGEMHHFIVVKFPLFDHAGLASAVAGIATDITALKKAQFSLEETTRLQRAILDSAPYVIVSTDEWGIIRTFNRTAEKMLGYTAEDVIGKATPDIFLDPHEIAQRAKTQGVEMGKDIPPTIVVLGNKAIEGVFDESIMTHIRKDGSRWPGLVSLTALRDGEGRVTGYLGIATDITERLRLEGRAARAKANELSRSVINAMGEGVVGLDREMRIVFANPKAEQLLDLTESELRGQVVCDVVYGCMNRPVDEFSKPCHLHEVVEQGLTVQGDDTYFFRGNGESFPVSYIASPILEGETVTGAALSFQDISLRRAAENALQHHMVELARINAELDEFTFVASHDLQEPLRKLLAFSDWLRRDLGENRSPRVEQDLEFIVDAVNRMQGLVQDLLALSRAGRASLSRKRVDLDDVAERALGNLEIAIREKRAQIDSDLLPEVWGDPTMLVQLYQNLIGNALKFSGPHSPRIRLTAGEKDGEWVFGVEDNGIGVKPEYFEQIFQPFKRLHGRGKYEGSGIGLSICRKVVERHGGRIWVESEEGHGAHFRFTLGEKRETV